MVRSCGAIGAAIVALRRSVFLVTLDRNVPRAVADHALTPKGRVTPHRLLLASLGLSLGCGSAKRDDAPPPAAQQPETTRASTPTRRPDGSYVLASYPAASGDSLTYELLIPPCDSAACPIRVRLLGGRTPYDSAAVEWASVVEAPRTVERSAGLIGVGDPLELVGNVPVWETGDGETAVATAARTVPVAPSTFGLLVHQSGGAEHVKRLHYLFVAHGRRLVAAWRGWEGQGLTGSTVDTMDVDRDGNSEILYWRFASPDGDVSDWQLSVQRWDASQSRAEETAATAGPPLSMVFAATMPTASAAAKFLYDHGQCLGAFRVLPAPSTRGQRRFAVAGITARQPLADSAARAARGCFQQGGVSVVALGNRRK